MHPSPFSLLLVSCFSRRDYACNKFTKPVILTGPDAGQDNPVFRDAITPAINSRSLFLTVAIITVFMPPHAASATKGSALHPLSAARALPNSLTFSRPTPSTAHIYYCPPDLRPTPATSATTPIGWIARLLYGTEMVALWLRLGFMLVAERLRSVAPPPK
jgi:hypothetical protein